MTTFQEEVRKRQSRAEEWISEAEKHVRAASYLLRDERLRTLVLYHLQQSMEMAAKGLARASGIPHGELRLAYGHNNLFLLVKVTQLVIESMDAHKQIDDVLARFYQEGKDYDSARHIQRILEATASPKRAQEYGSKQYAAEVFASAKRMPPEEVKSLLSLFDQTISLTRISSRTANAVRELKDTLSFRIPAPDVNWTDQIVEQTTQQLFGRTSLRPDPATVALVRDVARRTPLTEDVLAELKANRGKTLRYDFDGGRFVEETTGIWDMLSANLGLLIIGSMVWAHESYSRYPAEPDSPDSIEQAARERKLGVKHYTDDMGVIRHIRPLTARAERTIKLLKNGYKAGFFLMSAMDANS